MEKTKEVLAILEIAIHNKLFKQDKIQLAVFVPQHFSQLNFAPERGRYKFRGFRGN